LRARAVALFDAGREASEALQRVDGEIRLGGVRGAILKRNRSPSASRSIFAHRDRPGGRAATIAFVAEQSRDEPPH